MEEEKKTPTREEINESFKELLQEEDFSIIIDQVPNIKAAYDEAHRSEYQKQLNTFLKVQEGLNEAEKKEQKSFKFETDDASHRFKELYTIFTEKKKDYKKALAEKEEENFIAKTAVIAKLKELVEKELSNIGEAFNSFKALQEEWKTIGEVNKARFQSLQTEYSHLIDSFFYSVNIHKNLQNYSFEKNSASKKDLIAKLKELEKNDSIIQLEHYIKSYQKEWDEIGPTFQEEWESIKEEYWQNVNAIYTKIREHYLKIREKQKEAISKKETLIQRARDSYEALKESDKPSKWNALANELKEMQQEWKKTGFSKKTKDEELWQEFKKISNAFFDHTKMLYSKLNEKRDIFENKKKALINKANELKTSKAWKETTAQFIKLQEEWKKTGSLSPKKDQKLWTSFRSACNTFFDNKKTFFATLDDRQDENLKQKNKLCIAIEEAKNTEELKEKLEAWWTIGHVPKKSLKSSNEKFNVALKKACAHSKIEEEIKESLVFEAKINAYKKDEDANMLLQKEKRFVKEKIDKLKEEINQFENNLSFFGESKGAQKLKEVVEKRIHSTEEQLKNWKEKFKQI